MKNIKTFEGFLGESDDEIEKLENLLLSNDVSNLELVLNILEGMPYLFSSLFGGDLQKLCLNKKENLLKIFVLNNDRNYYFKIFNFDDFGSIQYNNTKVEFIPFNLLNKLKRKFSYANIVFDSCEINLYGKLVFDDFFSIQFTKSKIISGKIFANTIILDSIKDISSFLKWLDCVELKFQFCESLINLKDISKLKLKKLMIWNCKKIQNFEGFPRTIKSFDFFGNSKHLTSLKYLPNELDYFLLANTTLNNLNYFPKKIQKMRYFEVYDQTSKINKEYLKKNGISIEDAGEIGE